MDLTATAMSTLPTNASNPPAAAAPERLFAVQAFKAEGFSLVAQTPQRCDNEREARNLAARLFKTYPAVVAWAVTVANDRGDVRQPEILLSIGRVPKDIKFSVPDAPPVIDLLDELVFASEHPETMPRGEIQSLFRRAAREIATFRQQSGRKDAS